MNSNRNTESESYESNEDTISSISELNNNQGKTKPAISERRSKYLANKNAAHSTLKQASKNQTNGKWVPRAHNIMGLIHVRRKHENEKTFISHAISRWEKRKINQELSKETKNELRSAKQKARETRKAAVEANKESRRLIRQTKRVTKASAAAEPKVPGKRGRPKKSTSAKNNVKEKET